MHSGLVVSYQTILENVYRNFGFNYDVRDEEALEWLAAFMAHTNVGVVLKPEIAYIRILEGRGDLPRDLQKITQTAWVDGVNTIEEAECGEGTLRPMRLSTDNFHMRYTKDDRDYTTEGGDTYIINNNFIFPSFNKGFIALSYDAIPTDGEGYPTIPADEQWRKAAEFEIAYRIATKLWIQDNMRADKFQWFERERDWYFAQAVNFAKMPNGVDEMEAYKNDALRTIPKVNMHSNFFANMQLPEQRKFRPKTQGTVSNITTFLSDSNPPINP